MSRDPWKAHSSFSCVSALLMILCILDLGQASGHTFWSERKGDREREKEKDADSACKKKKKKLNRKVMNKLSKFSTTCHEEEQVLGLDTLALC